MFTKLLIANRGEIARRVIRTAKKMGIETVAIYSDIDCNSLFVHEADEAYRIGPATVSESYLAIDKIIAIAKASGAEAIHPGYGFLSENAQFAARCEQENIVFIGPKSTSIAAMGSKSEAKSRLQVANVPLIPGYHGTNQDTEYLQEQARAIGYPVLLKASLGGGGKGMRVVECDETFQEALSAAKREAHKAFGDDHILIEKYIASPRHVEVQVFFDHHKSGVFLQDRDCSIQRRHQKVIEEAPAPNITPETRRNMGEAALRCAEAIDYIGAGTIEFLLDSAENFYFMEMNTRLQVEHPVTEMITGVDLVEWQIRVASGEPLPLSQEDIKTHGHAIECRLYAEDTAKGFIPDAGYLEHLKFPHTSNEEPDLRVDTGVRQGDEISVYYDPMLAKLICRGANRNQAITRMGKMIHGTQVSGLETNLSFLGNILKSGDFHQTKLSTHFINDNLDALISPSTVSRDILLQAAIALINHTMEQQTAPPVSSSDCYSPWQLNDAWTATNGHQQHLKLYYGNSSFHFQCIFQATSEEFNADYAQSNRSKGRSFTLLPGPDPEPDGLALEIETKIDIRTRHHNDTLMAHLPNRTIMINSIVNEGHLKIFHEGECWTFERSQTHALHEDQQNQNNLVAPMHGKISMVLARQGLVVKKGTPLVMMEAMKMEHTMMAPFDGHVVQVCCHPNDLVEEGQELVELQPAEAPISDSGED